MKPVAQKIIIGASLVLLATAYGVIAERNQHRIASLVDEALQIRFVLFDQPWYLHRDAGDTQLLHKQADAMMPGLTKLVHFSGRQELAVSVINSDGDIIHQWPISWFDIWPDADHLAYFRRPKSAPGTMIHGAEILANGDLLFNFEYLGMVRLDACGKVIWRLSEQTHHSIDIDDEGFIWTSAHQHPTVDKNSMPLHWPYYIEPYLYRISPAGEVVNKQSVLQILADNQLYGALYLSSLHNTDPVVKGDTLHVNDVEVFPATLAEGFIKHGDIMVSMRNINSIMIVEPGSWRVKHWISGVMLRQHDPDFLDGNTIAVYDNNNRFAADDPQAFSRILRIHLPDNRVETIFQGSPQLPFYSKTLGKQQWLANGNILFSDSEKGRVMEITDDGRLVWLYANRIDQHYSAAVQEAERLPAMMDADFFARQRRQCQP